MPRSRAARRHPAAEVTATSARRDHAMTSSVAPVLSRLADGRGRTAADWATAPLADASRRSRSCRTATASCSPGRTGTGRCGRLPIRTNAVDGLCLTAVLAGTTDLDALFAEVRRVLRPAGTLVVVSPSAAVRSPGQLRLRALHRHGWANRSALDDVGWLLAAADFAVISDDRVAYGVDVPAATPTRSRRSCRRRLVAAAAPAPCRPARRRARWTLAGAVAAARRAPLTREAAARRAGPRLPRRARRAGSAARGGSPDRGRRRACGARR